jgi:hypothetical protein
MKLVYNNQKLRVSWMHIREPICIGGKGKRQIQCSGATECIIQKDERDGQILYSGTAYCSANQPGGYKRDSGRKRSLANALKAIPKGDRFAFWVAYFESTADKDNVAAKLKKSISE